MLNNQIKNFADASWLSAGGNIPNAKEVAPLSKENQALHIKASNAAKERGDESYVFGKDQQGNDIKFKVQ